MKKAVIVGIALTTVSGEDLALNTRLQATPSQNYDGVISEVNCIDAKASYAAAGCCTKSLLEKHSAHVLIKPENVWQPVVASAGSDTSKFSPTQQTAPAETVWPFFITYTDGANTKDYSNDNATAWPSLDHGVGGIVRLGLLGGRSIYTADRFHTRYICICP